MSDDPSRRIRLDLITPAEKAIFDAGAAVEAAGADIRLTHALNKLIEARNLVADFVDGVPFGEGYPRPTSTPNPPPTRDMSTPENREFWASMKRVADEAAKWPAWMKAGVSLQAICDLALSEDPSTFDVLSSKTSRVRSKTGSEEGTLLFEPTVSVHWDGDAPGYVTEERISNVVFIEASEK